MKKSENETSASVDHLPGLDCGLCGSKTCGQFARIITERPEQIEKCIHLARKPTGVPPVATRTRWTDSLDREFDFVLEAFPRDPGPREIIIPHNPARTAELGIARGDVLIGRPLGMSCGCPITHCGIAMEVDRTNGVIVWCVTGPLQPRAGAHKDLGYYSAQGYEGIVAETRAELKIGMRYWFMPHRCMLQWRHSGLVNFLNRGKSGLQVRVEGLYIG